MFCASVCYKQPLSVTWRALEWHTLTAWHTVAIWRGEKSCQWLSVDYRLTTIAPHRSPRSPIHLNCIAILALGRSDPAININLVQPCFQVICNKVKIITILSDRRHNSTMWGFGCDFVVLKMDDWTNVKAWCSGLRFLCHSCGSTSA